MQPNFNLAGKAIRRNLDGDEDPQSHQKDAAERQWRTALLQFWRGQLARIEKKLEPGIPKSRKAIEDLPKRLDKSFWDDENRLLLAEILPLLSDGATEAALFSAETIEGATGIGIDWTLINTAAAKWARGYAGELVKGITKTTRGNVGQHVTEFVETPGMTIGDLRRKLTTLPAFNDNRARMVAVTEVTRSYFEGNMATVRTYENEGLFTWEKRWNTVNDGLVCKICRPLHRKKVAGLDTPFDTLVGPLQGPPAHPRCILPGNEIVALGPISGAAKSFYVGPCIEATLADGRKLTATQNHPILTPRGWVTAQLLNEGDDVICTSSAEGILASIEPDYDHSPAAIEEIFGTLMEAGFVTAMGVPATTKDFHGDGRFIDGDIQIIYPDSLLLDDIEARLNKLRRQLGLGEDNARAISFSGGGNFTTFVPRDDPPSGGSMSGGDLGGALSGRHSSPLDSLGGRLIAGDDVSLQKMFAKDASANAYLARQLILRFASKITTEKIVKIRNFDFSDHVYDLQCDLYQLYTCNGILSSNCRCAISFIPVVGES